MGYSETRGGVAFDTALPVTDPALHVRSGALGFATVLDFQSYRQDLIVGASLQVSVPVGQYDSSKLVNLGTNRWFFKPEIGASKALGLAWQYRWSGGI